MYILGINSAYHESSASLIKDNNIVACVEEERFNRIKHAKTAEVFNPHELPWNSINYCLNSCGIDLNQIDEFAYSFHPGDRLVNQINVDDHEIISGSWGTKAGEKFFFNNLKKIPYIISEKIQRDVSESFHFIPHHLTHAASAYYVSGFNETSILVADGIAESASTWLGVGKDKEMINHEEIDYPNSIGFVWEKLSEFLGFTMYDACKVMALAALGDWRDHLDTVEKLIYWDSHKSTFFVNPNILQFRTDNFAMLEQLFNIPKRSREDEISIIHKNIAASLQHITEEIILNLLKKLRDYNNSNNLCYSGGVALNCVVNKKIIEQSKFKNLYIQPAANDAGTSLGAALLVANQINTQRINFNFEPTSFGPSFNDEYIERILNEKFIKYEKFEDVQQVLAQELDKGSIVAYFQEGLEFGPRALGNRSILADPRKYKIKDELNEKVKFRESFRPFGASVLAECVKDWFVIDRILSPLKYMLVAVDVKNDKKDIIPAILHIDNTSRIQIVDKNVTPHFYKLIKNFYNITGVPILLNTSLNIQEPIVCTPDEALDVFLKSGIDVLVLGDYLIKR